MTTAFILGISAYYHDSAACQFSDGEIVTARDVTIVAQFDRGKTIALACQDYDVTEDGG